MYTEKVMDHFQNPRNVGEIENASGVGTVGNAKCFEFHILNDLVIINVKIDSHNIWLWSSCCYKQYGDRTCKRKKHLRRTSSHKQGGYGSAGRTSACKSTLFTACRGSNPCCALGLCRKTRN